MATGAAGQWVRVSTILDCENFDADSCLIRIDNDGGAGKKILYDQIMLELYVEGGDGSPSSYSPPINQYRLKDQQTIPMINSAGASAAMNVNPLAGQDVGSTAKITVGSHSVQMSGNLISYSFGTIDGLDFNTLYYVYCDDYDYIGGAVTYVATEAIQELTADVARRYIGKVTTPSNGSGDTAPPFNDCLDENMWLTPNLQAKDACVGDVINVFDTGFSGLKAGLIEGIEKGVEDCVNITSQSGCEVICTLSTPVTRADGTAFLAHNALNEYVYVNNKGIESWEKVISVVSVGVRNIIKLSVGNISFAAGIKSDMQIVTHNQQIKP
jgi:hypothetical protein